MFLLENTLKFPKERFGGTVDYFVRLWYEKESKRLRNTKPENVIYGWDKQDGFENAEQFDIPFN